VACTSLVHQVGAMLKQPEAVAVLVMAVGMYWTGQDGNSSCWRLRGDRSIVRCSGILGIFAHSVNVLYCLLSAVRTVLSCFVRCRRIRIDHSQALTES
jgi:hypothetical protein